jgi:hypothetical protein
MYLLQIFSLKTSALHISPFTIFLDLIDQVYGLVYKNVPNKGTSDYDVKEYYSERQ